MVCLKIFHKFDTTYQSSCFYYSFLKWLIFQMDFECFIGTLNVFLSPRQVHLLTELASGFSSPGLFWGNVSWGLFFFAGFTIRKEDKGPPIVKAELEKRRLADTHFIISLVVFYLIVLYNCWLHRCINCIFSILRSLLQYCAFFFAQFTFGNP